MEEATPSPAARAKTTSSLYHRPETRANTASSRHPPKVTRRYQRAGFSFRLTVSLLFIIRRCVSPFGLSALTLARGGGGAGLLGLGNRRHPSVLSHLRMMGGARDVERADAEMKKVLVRSNEGQESMTIELVLMGKIRKLNRPKEEQLSKALFRIKQSAAPPNKGSKRRKPPAGFGKADGAASGGGGGQTGPEGGVGGRAAEEAEEAALVCELLLQGTKVVPEDTPNQDAWQNGSVLRVGKQLLIVEVNPPVVDDLTLPALPVAGVPQAAVARMMHVDEALCVWTWERARPGQQEWEMVGCDETAYTPREDDVGWCLRATCVPRRLAKEGEGQRGYIEGEGKTAVSARVVERGPAEWAGDGRHDKTLSHTVAPQLRVVCYNLLASAYADTKRAREDLFPYVDEQHLSSEWRRQLQLHEIAGFRGDIVCLQEVDARLFEEYLKPHMAVLGYDGRYLNKAGKGVREGEALFWRKERYFLAQSRDVRFQDCFSEEAVGDGMKHQRLAPLLRANSELADVVRTKLTTVMQLALLEPVDGRGVDAEGSILVANTHLFFHPGASHIRMMQAQALLEEIGAARQEWCDDEGGGKDAAKVTVLVCGDLNSEPDTGAVELLANGRVSSQHYEWTEYAGFSWGAQQTEEEGEEDGPSGSETAAPVGEAPAGVEGGGGVVGVDLEHDLELASACGLGTPFTNYVRGYIGCLDYIFYQPSLLRVAASAGMPSHDQVKATALPSGRFPSDHVSLCYDLEWLRPAQSASILCRYPAGLSQRERMPQPASRHLVGKALKALEHGKFVALPTDTLYGLACLASSEEGIASLYSAKNRAQSVPLAICVGSTADISQYADTSQLPQGILEDLLPGPVTVVLKRLEGNRVCKSFNKGLDTIGVRVPGDDLNARREGFSFCRELARRSGEALALTSANISQKRSTVNVNEFEELWQTCAHVYDGGVLEAGRAGSTVVDLTEVCDGHVRILREGCAIDEVRKVMASYHLSPRQ